MRSFTICSVLLLVSTVATPALAVDGVLEINHTCAVQTGCFPGDGPGYPVFIDGQAGGSYRLTSNLIVPNENTDGILFNTSDIGIDLNNFAIISAACVGSTTDCTPASGTGSGIERTSSLNRGVSVKNGSITGMGNYGVFLGDLAHITNIDVRWNRVDGINTSSGSTLSGSTAFQNGRHGINVFTGSAVSGNTAHQNGSHGIIASTAAKVSDNRAYQNGSDGINAATGSTVLGNTVYLNGRDGIRPSTGSVVSRNSAFGNVSNGIFSFGSSDVSGNATNENGNFGIAVGSGSSVSGNTVADNGNDGIRTLSGCTVQGNTVRGNTGFGLDLEGSGSAFRDNVITGNTLGSVNGGVNAGGNACNSSLTCP